MKMIDRYKAQDDFGKLCSLFYAAGFVWIIMGFLIAGPLSMGVGAIILTVTSMVSAAVSAIKTYIYQCFTSLYLKVQETPHADVHN